AQQQAAVDAIINNPEAPTFENTVLALDNSSDLLTRTTLIFSALDEADNTPELNNYRYRCKTSPFFKIGFDYNFLYKSSPDYQIGFGMRLGWSAFRYDITDITITSGYWDQTNHFALLNQSASVLWAEALLGIKVKIAGPVSMGWSFRYHRRLHTRPGAQSNPWFVPGYGGNGSIGGTFSVFYTLPLARRNITHTLPKLPTDTENITPLQTE
ncbi:MAG: hypothetical protein K2H75_07915, partial [Muribaculaceae bacterium]|nr:hypothetical protein [Muribaculaceae bacterium]